MVISISNLRIEYFGEDFSVKHIGWKIDVCKQLRIERDWGKEN